MTPAILELITKGLTLLPSLIQAGADTYNTIANLQKLAAAAKAGNKISDADLNAIEAQFDADLADFNTPMTS